jgi:proteasome lid subunit RPN8/RPN11
LYYHVKKRKISKQDIGIFIVALLFIVFSLVILYLNLSTISFSLISGVDHSATIIIESDVNNRLYELYQESGDVEFVACIKGDYNNGRYQIYDLEEVPTVSKSIAAIEAQDCSKLNNLGTIHSHPDGICEPSKQDIYTFGQKNDLLMGIICKKDNYGFFTKKNFDKSMFYLIKDVGVTEEFKKESSPFSLIIILLSLLAAYLIMRFKDKILDILKLFKKKKYTNLLIIMNLMNKTEKIMINRLIKTDGLLKQDLMNKLGLSKSSFNDAILRLQRSSLIVIKKAGDGERVYLSARAKN